MRFVGIAMALGMAGIASAEPAPVQEGGVPHGFVWEGQESLDGRVTDAKGHGVAADVHVVIGGTERVIKSARDGSYHINFRPNTRAVVFVRGALTITSTAATSHGGSDGETVDMHELLEPAEAVKIKKRPLLPTYTDDAKDYNQWIRAWVLLDIDEHGTVQRVKLLEHPGFGLDNNALRAAFALSFEPARDRSNRPMRDQIFWPIDWPPYWWLNDTFGSTSGPMPEQAARLPCAHGGLAKVTRACNEPPVATTLSARWIARSKADDK